MSEAKQYGKNSAPSGGVRKIFEQQGLLLKVYSETRAVFQRNGSGFVQNNRRVM
jgi:hypothetical protein